MSPDEMSMQQAVSEGVMAGDRGYGASMNPYQAGVPEHDAWENARTRTIGARLNSSAHLARFVC